MAVPVTGDRGQAVILAARRSHQCLIQLALDHGLDEGRAQWRTPAGRF